MAAFRSCATRKRQKGSNRCEFVMCEWLARPIACAAGQPSSGTAADHTNPPVTGEPTWDAPETRALAKQACFDCHGNETEWPAYASVAPASWLVQRDVKEGRAVLNVSEWPRPQEEAKNASEEVLEGGDWREPLVWRWNTTRANTTASQCAEPFSSIGDERGSRINLAPGRIRECRAACRLYCPSLKLVRREPHLFVRVSSVCLGVTPPAVDSPNSRPDSPRAALLPVASDRAACAAS